MSDSVGFEMVCTVTRCIHNDAPGCKAHKALEPIRIVPGEDGRAVCLKFEEKR